MVTIETEQQLQEVLQAESGKPVFLFKHSTRCPVSAAAHKEVTKFEESSSVPVYLVRVIEERPLSNYIASTYGIKHESPQVLLVQDDSVLWNASHWKVTKNALDGAVAESSK